MEYLLTLVGFIILIGSGNFLVKGSVSLAKYFGLSSLVTGVTIVAFGTSAPELLVSLQAALSNHPEIAVGNVIGSNISNIALVMAVTAIIFPISIHKNSLIYDWPVMMGAGVLFGIFALDHSLSLIEGIILNFILVAYILFSIKNSGRNTIPHSEPEEIKMSFAASAFIIILSSGGLVLGARLLVNNVTLIAENLGVSERAIAISMLAVGTSLPELVTSIIAALQKETDISVGNIMGSNIFNILSVLGITAVIKTVRISPLILIDTGIMLVLSLMLLLMMIPSRKGKITCWEGGVLIISYIIYLAYVFQ